MGLCCHRVVIPNPATILVSIGLVTHCLKTTPMIVPLNICTEGLSVTVVESVDCVRVQGVYIAVEEFKVKKHLFSVGEIDICRGKITEIVPPRGKVFSLVKVRV